VPYIKIEDRSIKVLTPEFQNGVYLGWWIGEYVDTGRICFFNETRLKNIKEIKLPPFGFCYYKLTKESWFKRKIIDKII